MQFTQAKVDTTDSTYSFESFVAVCNQIHSSYFNKYTKSSSEFNKFKLNNDIEKQYVQREKLMSKLIKTQAIHLFLYLSNVERIFIDENNLVTFNQPYFMEAINDEWSDNESWSTGE